jgi:hypothetical protein
MTDTVAPLPSQNRAAAFISRFALDVERSPGAMICKQACIMASGSSLSQKKRWKFLPELPSP